MRLARFIADCLLVLITICLPVWIALPLAFAIAFFFDDYFEIVFLGLLLDALTATPSAKLFGFQFFFTALSFFLLLAVSWFKKKIVL